MAASVGNPGVSASQPNDDMRIFNKGMLWFAPPPLPADNWSYYGTP
jgi:hypothetical protein